MSLATLPPTFVSAEQVRQYHEDGFLVVREVFSANEIAALAAEADTLFARQELIDKQNIRCRWQDHAETKECRFDCFDPVSDLSPAIGRFARDSRLINLLTVLYGEPAHLFKD